LSELKPTPFKPCFFRLEKNRRGIQNFYAGVEMKKLFYLILVLSLFICCGPKGEKVEKVIKDGVTHIMNPEKPLRPVEQKPRGSTAMESIWGGYFERDKDLVNSQSVEVLIYIL